jgi:hypothetical protein
LITTNGKDFKQFNISQCNTEITAVVLSYRSASSVIPQFQKGRNDVTVHHCKGETWSIYNTNFSTISISYPKTVNYEVTNMALW